jgi:hypothetical protein
MIWIFWIGLIWIAVLHKEFRKVAYCIGGFVGLLLVLGIIP